MRRKIIYILVCMLMFSTVAGAMASSSHTETKSLNKASTEEGYSHDILGEFGTATTCDPCKYAHAALKNIYAHKEEWNKPFYYISLVCDKNTHAKYRAYTELGLAADPTVFWDGGWRKDIGAGGVQSAMNKYNTSIIKCGNRDVADIDLSLDVEWLGAVNPSPPDGAINVLIEQIMKWTITAMEIDVSVDNNEASTYNGHLHVYVTDIESSMGWYDKWDYLYTFAFLDYAFNEDIAINSGGTWEDSTDWDGCDYSDGYGHFFKFITEDNIMVIASVFDEDSDHTDETAGCVAGVGTDPKTFDIYFGNSTPPPKVISNTSDREYDPEGLEFNTTYYWKVDVWDNLGEPTYGDIWNFTTRENNPPNTPYDPDPLNNSPDVYINTNLSWKCEDPDMDDVTYDVYFGDIYPPPEVMSNQIETTYDPTPLDDNLEFNTTYYWQIVARDEYNYTTSGPIWNFRTEVNHPPNKASDPFPEDGETSVPVNLDALRWNGSDPNPGDTLKYDVYFDDEYPLTKRAENRTENWWKLPYELSNYTWYYWRIDTWDRDGLKTVGDNWSFKTGINHPPGAPKITGPTSGKIRVKYWYNFTATDPDGHDIYYEVDWDDGHKTDWLGPYSSGETMPLNHTWDKKGTYNITAIAKDIYGAESEKGYLVVTMPKNKQSAYMNFYQFLQKLIQRFPFPEKLFSLFPVFNRILTFQ